MRTINEHQINELNRGLEIRVIDEPGPGGAHHLYQIVGYTPGPDAGQEAYEAYRNSCGGQSFTGHDLPAWNFLRHNPATAPLAQHWCAAAAAVPLMFQNGPINEAGLNGISHEALLAIIRDRLRSFQAGPYACRENAIALTKLDEAAMWLEARTRSRMQRGVEGTHAR